MGMYFKDGMTEEEMRASTAIDCSGDQPVTKQEFKKDCDVNVIIARCLRSGVPLPGIDAQQVFADVSQFGDFSEAVRIVHSANDAFMTLDADLRARFSNNPARLIEFIQNDANYDEAVKLGLVEVKPGAAPKEQAPGNKDKEAPKP